MSFLATLYRTGQNNKLRIAKRCFMVKQGKRILVASGRMLKASNFLVSVQLETPVYIFFLMEPKIYDDDNKLGRGDQIWRQRRINAFNL
jgi:hypothetical protein